MTRMLRLLVDEDLRLTSSKIFLKNDNRDGLL